MQDTDSGVQEVGGCKGQKKGKIVQIPWRNVWNFRALLGFPFFFSFFSFCSKCTAGGKSWMTAAGTVELHAAPTPVPLPCKIMLKSKITAKHQGCQQPHNPCEHSTACCEVNALHILYPAFALKYCLLPPFSLRLSLSLFSPFCAKLFPGKSTNNAFMLIKLAPLLICLQFAFLARPGKK